MKTKISLKIMMMTVLTVLSLTACKKNKPEPVKPPVEVKTITITELRALSTGASVKLNDGLKVKGIVISDVSTKNIDAKTVVLQEATDKPGVIVNFDGAQTFAVGDELKLTISNQTLAQVNGEITLQNIPLANAKKTGTGTITAKATTITEIQTNKTAWNGTLVSLTATDLSSIDGKYKGTLTVIDASGALAVTVLAGATFENTSLPASVSKLTGIVRISGSDVRLELRSATDVAIGNINKTITVDFSNQLTDTLGKIPDFDDPYAIATTPGYKTTPDVGNWAMNVNGYFKPFPFANIAGDESLTNGKTYFYLNTTGASNGSALAVSATKGQLKGLRKVTVTFAYSNATLSKTRAIGLSVWKYVAVAPMTAAGENKIQIGMSAGFADPQNKNNIYQLKVSSPNREDLFEIKSPEYTEAGKEYTMSYTMPTEAEAKAKAVGQTDIDKYLKYPTFIFYNRCTLKTNDKPYLVPIIVKKVVFGLE